MLTFHKFIDFLTHICTYCGKSSIFQDEWGVGYADRMILLTDCMMNYQKQLECGLYRSKTAELTYHNGCQQKAKCGWWVKLVCVALQLDS